MKHKMFFGIGIAIITALTLHPRPVYAQQDGTFGGYVQAETQPIERTCNRWWGQTATIYNNCIDNSRERLAELYTYWDQWPQKDIMDCIQISDRDFGGINEVMRPSGMIMCLMGRQHDRVIPRESLEP